MGRPRKSVSLIGDGDSLTMIDVENTASEDAAKKTDEIRECVSDQEQAEPVAPVMFAKEWNDYVLSQLNTDEIIEGAPTVDGLRRVAQQLLGPIVCSKPEIVSVSEHQTVVSYTVQFHWLYNDCRVGTLVEFGGVGDVTDTNAEFPYNQYRGPLAETRAEGRALKKALGLKRILTADEINPTMTIDPKDKVIPAQIVGIKNLCGILKIDINKFLNQLGEEMGESNITTLEEISRDFAAKCVQRLNAYQADNNNPVYQAIPESIKE